MTRIIVVVLVIGLISGLGLFLFPKQDAKDAYHEAPPALSDLTFSQKNTIISTSEAAPLTTSTSTTNVPTYTFPMATQPPMTIDSSKTYTAVMHTTLGDITVLLNAKGTPVTVNNFVALAQNNFYNETIFHRVIKGFMIQGGDPNGTGTGGPGYRFNDEPFTGEYTRGTIAMANAGPNTNGSQFFIMHADIDLPKNYVIFGKVTSGMEVVDAIANSKVMFENGEKSRPVEPTIVTSVEIKVE